MHCNDNACTESFTIMIRTYHSFIPFIFPIQGTDFKIHEPKPFWKGWLSHKFNGPGVRYEVGISIQSGQIVWIFGPFPAGANSDLKIYQSRVKSMLLPGEMVEADGTYESDRTVRGKHDHVYSPRERLMKGRVLARHENVNAKFKSWGVLSKVFRCKGEDMMEKHRLVFNAITVITELELQHQTPLYPAKYSVTRRWAAA